MANEPIPLHRLLPGQTARVVELIARDPARLERLGAFGLTPGARLYLQQIHPAIIVRVDETELSLDANVAAEILVEMCGLGINSPAAPPPPLLDSSR